jgi:hypothetical protein
MMVEQKERSLAANLVAETVVLTADGLVVT